MILLDTDHITLLTYPESARGSLPIDGDSLGVLHIDNLKMTPLIE